MGFHDPYSQWLLCFGSLTSICLVILIVNYRFGEKVLRLGTLGLPDKVTLVPTSTASWDSYPSVSDLVGALSAQDFQHLDDYKAPELGSELRVFLSPDQKTLAVVNLKLHVHLDFFTAFEDGTTLTVSNYGESAAPQMPGHSKILRLRDKPEDLWSLMKDLRNRSQKTALTLDKSTFQEQFKTFYARHVAWYKSYLASYGQSERPPSVPPMHSSFDFLLGEALMTQLGINPEEWARLLTKAVVVHDKSQPRDLVDDLARVYGEDRFPADTLDQNSDLPPRYLVANLLERLGEELRPSKHTVSVELEKVDIYLPKANP